MTQKFSRRELLNSIGELSQLSLLLKLAAGTGAASLLSGCGGAQANEGSPPENSSGQTTSNNAYPKPKDWTESVGQGRHVVIIGGGVSGLTCAYEMSKLGFDITVLEADSRLGGRNLTIRAGDSLQEQNSLQYCDFSPGLYFNAGPARIPSHHQRLLNYCRTFNVSLEPFINNNRSCLVHEEGFNQGVPVVARELIADLMGYLGELSFSGISAVSLSTAYPGANANQLQQILTQITNVNSAGQYLGSAEAGYSNPWTRTGIKTPRALVDVLRSGIARHLDFYSGLDQQSSMLQPVGGMDQIIKGFEAHLDVDIRLEHQVTNIETSGQGTTLTYSSNGSSDTLEADFCICTVPATVLRNIGNNFSADHQREISNFMYAKACKVAYEASPFWEQEGIYGGISWTSQRNNQIWYPSSGFGQQTGVLVGAYTLQDIDGTYYQNRTPSERLESVKQNVAALHPGSENELTQGMTVSWPNMPFAGGAWGQSSANALMSPSGTTYFAGEHLSHLKGWQEGAILSAYRAIDGIYNQLT